MDLQKLLDRRASLWADMQDLMERGLDTAEDIEQYDRMEERMGELEDKIARAERHAERAEHMDEIEDRDVSLLPGAEGEHIDGVEDVDVDYEEAFRSYTRNGVMRMGYEAREALETGLVELSEEARALSIATDAAGGYTVPDEFMNQIQEERFQWGGFRRANPTVIRTASGATLNIPTADDSSNTGAILTEGNAVSEADPTFGTKSLNAHVYTSQIVRVSRSLLQDSAFDLEAYLARVFGVRIGRIENEHFTTGSGTNEPEGLLTGATTEAAAAAAAIDEDDLINLIHAVDPTYRNGASFMLNDATLKEIRLLKDGDSRPLWQPNVQQGEPSTIFGYPYTINVDMGDVEADGQSVAFGDYDGYWVRDVVGGQMLRLEERYAEYLHIAFLFFTRTDGKLIDTASVRVLEHPSS